MAPICNPCQDTVVTEKSFADLLSVQKDLLSVGT